MQRRAAPALHEDAGLQPERTALAWGRTMLSLVITSCLFLRWLPRYGGFAASLMLLALLCACAIALTQRRRYRASASGIRDERIRADGWAVLSMGLGVMLLAGLGIVAVLFMPLAGR